MRPGIIFLLLIISVSKNYGQLLQELQVSYGDGSRDTFDFVIGNENRVPWFNLQDVLITQAVDTSGSSEICDSIVTELSGSIALFDRGTCLISDKIQNLLETGALGMIMCNSTAEAPPILGNSGPPFLPTGTMWKHDCEKLTLKLDSETRVNWISTYLLDCDDSVANPPSLCSEAEDFGIITNCPSITNTATITTGNRCNDEPQSEACFSNEFGATWIKWTTGEAMTRLNIQLIGLRGSDPYLEIYDESVCGSTGNLITCLTGDSTFLVEGLDPLTTYYALLGEQEKTADAGSFIAIRNANCNLTIKGVAFHDENGNGVLDVGEDSLNHVKFIHKKDGRNFYTQENGTYETLIGAGLDTICLSPDEQCWSMLDASSGAVSSLDGDMQMVHLPLVPSGVAIDSAVVSVTAARLRCNSEIIVWITIENAGCQSLTGELVMVLDSLLSEVNGEDTVRFDVDLINPSGSHTYQHIVNMPDESFIGDTITINAFFGEISATYADVLACAYDPNDKQVFPSRNEPNNYTLLDETLVYTIRFQNTGTDTAYDVTIVDTLSDLLDWSSAQLVSTSHEGRFSVTPNGIVKMDYENIFLVDSLTNEPLSHGFFQFRIGANVADAFTTIPNKASIFFDRNAPIITNEVRSTMVEFLDADEDGFVFWEECDDQNAEVNPNAEEIPDNGVDEDCDGEELMTSSIDKGSQHTGIMVFPNPSNGIINILLKEKTGILLFYDVNGSMIKNIVAEEKSFSIDISDFTPGVYYLKLVTGTSEVVKIIKQ